MSCAVCTAPLTALGGDLAACPTGDVFHESCIRSWIVSRGQCIACKQRFTQQQLVTLKLPHNDTAAVTQRRRPITTTAPTTPLSSSHHHTATSSTSAVALPPSPTLPPQGTPLTLAQVEELIASYRRAATTYNTQRTASQQAMSTKLQQLQLAYSRVVSDIPHTDSTDPSTDTDTSDDPSATDDALMHRHMLMAKLLSCVHEARLYTEEEHIDEMTRVVRRVAGESSTEEQTTADAVRVMEQLMDEVDAQCWERIRTKRQQLVDMEEEMRREQHEKQQLSLRVKALERRRQQLEDSMLHATASQTRKRKPQSPSSLSTPTALRISPYAQSHSAFSRPLSPSTDNSSDSEDDSHSPRHTTHSPPLSSSSSSLSALKRRKLALSSPAVPLTSEQFASRSNDEKLALPRLTILLHCPSIESFLSHQLHLRTLKRRWPDNEWRKINTTYTGMRKRKGLKGRGRGRQVLPATGEEQQVWRDVRKRELELLMGGVAFTEEDGVGGANNGDGVRESAGGEGGVRGESGEIGGASGGDGGGGGVDEGEYDDERSESEDDIAVKVEASERSEGSEEQKQEQLSVNGNGTATADENSTPMQA